MQTKFKYVAIAELLIILLLAALLFANLKNESSRESKFKDQTDFCSRTQNYTGLLSPRVYSGILEPKSLLIVNFDPLRQKIEQYALEQNISLNVYLVNLRNGASFGINEKKGFLPASLNKVPTAIMILKKIERGRLSFDTMIAINESDKSSSFGNLYKTNAAELPLRYLLEKMLKESDNTAFNALRRQTDESDLPFLLSYLDYHSDDIVVANATINGRDIYEFTTAKSMYNLFASLYLSTLLEPEHSEYILSLLSDTVFDIKKIAGLPENVTVSQKFGEEYVANEKYFHTCGIMYIDRSRIFFCVATQDLGEKKAQQTIGVITYWIYKFTIDIRSELDTYKEE